MGVSPLNNHSSALGHPHPVAHVHFKTFVVVAAICFIYFASLVGIVGSGVLAQSIGELFHNSSQSTRLSPIITLITTVLNLPLSQAADYWGRKWILVATTLAGVAGSITISRANKIETIVVGFTILGISYGSQSSLLATVSEVMPRKQRPLGQAVANVAAGLGAIVGLVMGGALLRNGNLEKFRIYFYVVAGIFAAAAAGCVFCYSPPPRPLQVSLTQAEKYRRLDWIGYALFTSGLTLFCMALWWSQNPYDWKNVHILATLIIGVVLIIVFIVYEWRFKREGLLDRRLFCSRNFVISFGTIFVEGLSFFTTNTYFAYEVSILTKADFLMSCLHFSIVFFSAAAFAVVFGLYSWKRKSIRTPLLIGFTSLLISNVLMALSNPRTPKSAFWGFPLFAGLGLGAILPISMVAAQLSTPKELITLVSGLMISGRSFGAAIGLAINNAIFSGALSKNIPSKIAAASLPLGLPRSSLPALIGVLAAGEPQMLQYIPGITPMIIDAATVAFTEAYSIGFRNAWIAASCFSFVAVVATAFLKDPRSEFNDHIDAPAEPELSNSQTDGEKAHDAIVGNDQKTTETREKRIDEVQTY